MVQNTYKAFASYLPDDKTLLHSEINVPPTVKNLLILVTPKIIVSGIIIIIYYYIEHLNCKS